jgi:DNA-directed RNA polymerase subunit beta'
MLRTTLGQVLVNAQLPPALRDYNRVLDKKGIAQLFETVAKDHTHDYTAIAQKVANVGRSAAYSTGGYSFGLKHLRTSPATQLHRDALNREIDTISAHPDLSDDEKEKRIVAATQAKMPIVQDSVYKESLAEKNPLALQILSGTRGSATNLRSIRAGDMLYTDHHDRAIPIPVLHSYAEGLTPEEYFAGSFGARKGVIDTKLAVAKSGAFGKVLTQATHRLIVTGHDDLDDKHAGRRGLPVSVGDPDNEGSLLAHDVGGYARNTTLTPRILKDISSKGITDILVRSPTVGGPPQGGVYSRDVGVRERGGLSPVGDYVGISAGQALSEKMTQGSLSSKHSGGVAGAGAAVSGFKYIDSLVQIPKTLVGGAIHAQLDGKISSIRPAPQGGTYIDIEGKTHHLGAGLNPVVEVGHRVEAGDILSEGVPNPGEVVAHKGIGEGRRYFTKTFRDAYANSGMSVNRRNVELLARGLINHVRMTDEHGDYAPGDVASYAAIERDWEPRANTNRVAPGSAIGKHLEVPVLHYSIGTKVKPSMLGEFHKFGINHVDVHDDPPPFEPVMIRGIAGLQHDPDPLVRHFGSNLQKATLDSVHRGGISDAGGTSFVAALADPTNFGRSGFTAGWRPSGPVPIPTR